MGGQKPINIQQNNTVKDDVDTTKLAAAAGGTGIAMPLKRNRAPKLSIMHHSATRTVLGTYFVVKAKSAYSDPVVVTNALLFIVALGGILNIGVFNSIFTGDPAHIAAAIVTLLVSIASIALRIFYSKTPLTLRK